MPTADLEFLGQRSAPLPSGTQALVLTIASGFPTIANAGVRVFRDDGNGAISQVGQGVVIDTSVNTPQGDTVFLAIPPTGKFAVAFQGQAVSVNGTAVSVQFVLTTETGALLEDFGGPRSSANMSSDINGAAFVNWAPPAAAAPAPVAGGAA